MTPMQGSTGFEVNVQIAVMHFISWIC